MTDKRFKSPHHRTCSPAFFEQASKFRFHFYCETCCFFNEETEECMHQYPNATHRKDYYFSEDSHEKILIFCREYEPE